MHRILSIFLGFLAINALASPPDSIGIEKKGKKILVLHKVDEGQSLFSILKRYNSNYSEFYQFNPTLKEEDKLKWQQVVKVPYYKPSEKLAIGLPPATKPLETPQGGKVDSDGIEVVDIPEATPKDTHTVVATTTKKITDDTLKKVAKPPLKSKFHVVAAGENLFSIAKKYSLKAWQIREWNTLKSDNLKIGQKLVVEKPASVAVASPTPKPTAPPTKSKVAVVKKDSTKKITQAPAGEASAPKTNTAKPNQPVPNAPTGRKMSEIGIAELMNGTTTKYLAFHKTAPIGTMIIVKNDANGQSVWVKVIGKLQGSSDAVIKISQKAFEKLQASDRRFRVSISYSLPTN